MKAPLRSLTDAAAALTICVLGANAWFSLTSQYDVNLVSGVWLALARDLCDGLFYRDLIGPTGYGGTRYFPLFFALIAGFMRVGLDPVASGHAASLAGAGVLMTGGYAFITQLGLRRSAAVPLAVLATAPYFIQQTIFAIRVEPLAAGLALWGLTTVASPRSEGSWRMMGIAAVWFTLATAAKPTSVWAPAAALIALSLARRRADTARLGLLTALGVLLLLGGVEWLSDGRFLRSVRAAALAGETPAGLVTTSLILRPVALVATSRILTVIFLLAAAALIACRSCWRQLPALAVVTTTGVTAVALATPGTILTNQIVELYVAAVLFLGWCAYTRPAAARFSPAVLALLLIWTSTQNVTRMTQLRRQDASERLPALRPALVAAVRSCEGPVLAESPLVPILAGESPTLLDPFAFRVVAARFPSVADDLIARLSRRQFACVVLEQDPDVPRGAAWYRNVHFGGPVMEAILRHYEYRASVGRHRFYRALP